MARIDLTVRGAGIFGLSIAWAARQRGAQVQIVDPNGPASGSSGGIVGALAPHVPENWNAKKAFQLESLLMAGAFWAEVEAESGVRSGYARSGRIQPITDAQSLQLAQQRTQTAKELWAEKATWQITEQAPAKWAPVSATGCYIHDTLSGVIHPRKACASLVAALQSRGVIIEAEAPIKAPTLLATGVAGLKEMSEQHNRSVGSGVKGQAALLRYDAQGLPQIFGNGLHIVPHADGTVAVGSTSERLFDVPDQTDEKLDALVSDARTLVPALIDAPLIERWAAARPRARSRAPMLGALPHKPNHYVANGGFKIGFGMAPKIAEVMVDLILEGRDNIPAGFRVEDNL
ncbi:MAG: FAD-binding oxidoreductase [Pseudomonadota bacterium]